MNRVLILTVVLFLVFMVVSCGAEDDSSQNTEPCTEVNKFCHSYGGLNWSDPSPEEMSQDEAEIYCYNIGGKLPTISELRILIQNCSATVTGGLCKVTDDCLNYTACWGEVCMGCDQSDSHSVFDDKGWFWSGSVALDSQYSWRINFDDGNLGAYNSSTQHPVRCVELTGNQALCPEDNKFCHTVNGLNWSDTTKERMSLNDASYYCVNIDGRLPTISELRTLVQNCSATETGGECRVTDDCLSYENCLNAACDGCELDDSGKYSVLGDTNYLWSSSFCSDANTVFILGFYNGQLEDSYYENDFNVRCVR